MNLKSGVVGEKIVLMYMYLPGNVKPLKESVMHTGDVITEVIRKYCSR